MKKIIPLILLFFISFLGYTQVIDWEAVEARYLEKYQPTEIPQWLFPMIFENGDGERDTIYHGYDVDSENGFLETKYGEQYMAIDSNCFKAFWSKCSNCDTLLVSDVLIANQFGHQVNFRNGKMPITFYFNHEYFNSNSLYSFNPLPNPPYVQGEIRQEFGQIGMGRWNKASEDWEDHCSWGFTVVIHEITDLCSWVSDSIHFNKTNPNSSSEELGAFLLNVEEWNSWLPTSATEATENHQLLATPNPSDVSFSFELPITASGRWQLYGPTGSVVRSVHFKNKSIFEIETQHLDNGIYFLELISETGKWYTKVLVWH